LFPPELIEILDFGYDDELEITVLKTNFSLENPIVNIEISHPTFDRGDNIKREWEIKILGYKKSRLLFYPSSYISISLDHPLLWEFNDIQCELYFGAKCKNVKELFADLYEVHSSVFDSYIPFETFLNNIGRNIFRLFDSHGGLLAKGPKKLLSKYKSCLDEYKLKPSLISERFPSYWDGQQFIAENLNAKILFLDESYIIADHFIFK
jgi:hypothetical protein